MAVLDPSRRIGAFAFLPSSLSSQITSSLVQAQRPNFAAALFKTTAAGPTPSSPPPAAPPTPRDNSWQMVNPNEYPPTPPPPVPLYKQPLVIAGGIAAVLALAFVATR